MEKKNVDIETVKENAKETVESVKELAKETTKKARSTAKKTADEAKKAADEAKKAAEAATRKAKQEVKKLTLRETYIQFAGQEYKESEIMEKVEAAYRAEGHRVGAIKSVVLYIKPEDGAAYYVINEKNTGKVEL